MTKKKRERLIQIFAIIAIIAMVASLVGGSFLTML